MKYKKLGKTDIEISVIGMGTWAISTENNDYWGTQEAKDSFDAIHASIDIGVNFFDSAEDYGKGSSEEVLGKALGHRRNHVIIATKIAPNHLTSPSEIRQACERSLHRLHTDVIDLYQIHWPNSHVPVEDALATLEALKDEGKIRVIGVSNFGDSYLQDVPLEGPVASNQLPYSLLWRVIEDHILPMSIDKGLSILCYSPLLQGLLADEFQSPEEVPAGRRQMRLFSEGYENILFHAIGKFREFCHRIGQPMARVAGAWVLAQRGVTSILIGVRNAQQAMDAVRMVDLKLPAELLEELRQLTDEIKQLIGANADMWEHESRMERRRVVTAAMR